MELVQLLDLGITGMLAAAVIALWRDGKEDKAYIRALLSAELDRQDNDLKAERQRKKLGRAVGIDLDEDTEGKRPTGFNAELAARRSLK